MRSLSAKISIFGMAICLFTGVAFSLYSHTQQKEYLLSSKLDESVDALLLLEESVKFEIDQLKSDVKFLASTPPVRGILRARNNQGIDPVDKSTEKLWRSRLSTIFEEMLYAKGRYSQIRYIGIADEGREIVRVNKSGARVSQVVQRNLQQKGNEDYFKEIIDISSSKIYLSDFSLNKEYGKVTIPEKLVLRAATLVKELGNEPFGVIVINVDYTEIFKNLNLILSKGKEFYILNDGKVLAHGKDERFSYDIRKIKEIELSNAFSAIQNKRKKDDVSKYKHVTYEEDGNYYIEKRVYYNDIHPNEYLTFLVVVSENNLLTNLDAIVQKNIIALAFILLLALIVSLTFSSFIGRPINKLKIIIDRLKDGKEIFEEDFKISINSKDEIGFVSKTIAKLSKDLVDKNLDLTRQQKALDISAIVVETDVKGKIIFVNENFVRISQYSREELIGQDHRIINSGTHSKDFFKQMWTTILDGRTWKGEVKNRAKDGSFYWVDTTIHPYLKSDGSIEKFVAIRFDITEKKQTMSELLDAKNKASSALEAKSNFLANMSHEIRTPLNGILGFTNLLKDHELKEELKEYVEQISGCSESLLMLINDILDLSKIEAGKLNLESVNFDLAKIIESTQLVFSTAISEKRITLSFSMDEDVPNYLESDPLRLRQVLLNLIGNAVKFTESGRVHTQVSLIRKESELATLKFSVLDTGIGISPDAQKKLFAPFVQADTSTTRQYGGSGLGLSISRKLVEAFGGKIWVDSNIDEGSTFSFSYQAKIATNKGTEEIAQERASHLKNSIDNQLSNLKFLVVDDNLINQKIAKKYLESLGATDITLANDGSDAVQLSQIRYFDIIFMDVQMPHMDGYEATRTIREKLGTDSYIIGLSANVFKEDISRGYEAGMDDYLGKPLKKELLQKSLEKYYSEKKKCA